MPFLKHNSNPLRKNTGDCVIRAIAVATGKSWGYIFEELVRIARVNCSIPNSPDVYNIYLGIEKGFKTIPVKYTNRLGNIKRLTAGDICLLEGTYIVTLANHVTAIKDGVIYDTWDCSKKSAYKIWKVQ